ALELTDPQVLGVDVIARRDVARREADDLPVAPDFLTHPPRAAGDFVAGPNILADLDPRLRVLEDAACGNLPLGDGHVVFGLQDDCDIGDRMSRHGVVTPPGPGLIACDSIVRISDLQATRARRVSVVLPPAKFARRLRAHDLHGARLLVGVALLRPG